MTCTKLCAHTSCGKNVKISNSEIEQNLLQGQTSFSYLFFLREREKQKEPPNKNYIACASLSHLWSKFMQNNPLYEWGN